MDILIVGNGFDLAHGLKTSYRDFLSYCHEKLYKPRMTYPPSDPYYQNLWVKHFINVQRNMGDTWIDVEKEIFRVIKLVKNLSILKNTTHPKIKPQVFTIDFNNNVFAFDNISNHLEESFGTNTPNGKGYIRIYPDNNITYCVYIANSKGFINFLYDQLRDFSKLFENYLLNEVLANMNQDSPYKLSLKTIGVKPNNKDVYLLSFNYTDTCERLYSYKFNTYCNIEKFEPIFVHGKAGQCENCNLILGTHSFENVSSTNPSLSISYDFNIFKKHNQRHKYSTIDKYQDLLQKLNPLDKRKKVNPVFHIIGHSLDETDREILRHILNVNKDSIINVYYHDEEAQTRLINRINDIIGEEEVMARVRFIYQHDNEKGILIPKDTEN